MSANNSYMSIPVMLVDPYVLGEMSSLSRSVLVDRVRHLAAVHCYNWMWLLDEFDKQIAKYLAGKSAFEMAKADEVK